MTSRRNLLLAVPPALFLGAFFVYPVASILALGLGSAEGPGASAFGDAIANGPLLRAAWFTTWQATVSTLLTLIVAFPAAVVFGRYDFPGKAALRAAITVPFVMPTVVVASAFLTLLGPGGPLGVDLRRSVWAILIAHVFYNYAVIVRSVSSALENLDPSLEDAARTLGATRLAAFRRITLPVIMPSVVAAASLVFLFTFTSFGVVLILGGLEFSTLEVAIWRATTQRLDLALAAVIAIVQLVGVSTILVLLSRTQRVRRTEVPLVASPSRVRRPATTGERWTVAGVVGATILFLGVPLAVLVVRSLSFGGRFSLQNYGELATRDPRGLFVPPAESIGNSLSFAIPATILAVGIGLFAAAYLSRESRRLAEAFDTLLMLPLGTSAVTIGFGFLVALDQPVDLRANPAIIPIAHALVAIPIVVRVTTPVMRSIRTRLREAASVLGAPPRSVWRLIDLPIIGRAIAVAAGFAFAVSLGEFGASSFIVRPDRPTLPTAIFRLLGFPGDATYGQAMALATILMVLTGVAVMAIDRFRLGVQADF
ncbi:MAG: iron ABC transporter permease [Acidimicrobiia bacterium]|nr:iron ABC transporter permease [Acidimicrobiia bacterium]